MVEPVFLGRAAGFGDDVPERAEDTLFIIFVRGCTGFVFFIAAGMVLCFGFVTRAVLITRGCVSYC